jgi:DNA-binding GntR family transcriptional regulator
MGETARTEVTANEWLVADDLVADRLNIHPGEKYLFIRLFRFLGDVLVGWQEILVTPGIGNLADIEALKEKQALNPLLKLKGKWVAETHVEQSARLADQKDIDLLGCPPNTPILCSNFKEFGTDGTTYSYSSVAFRADKFKWVFKVVGT